MDDEVEKQGMDVSGSRDHNGRIGIVRVGEYDDADAVELLLRSPRATEHAIVAVGGRDADFEGWRISLLSAIRPEDRQLRETVRLRAVRDR